MKIMFINNDGGGFADYVEAAPSTTVATFFNMKMGEGNNPGNYQIRVNRLPAAADQVLVEGDRISITPIKIEAGC